MGEREDETESPPPAPALPPQEELVLDQPLEPAPPKRTWRDRGPLMRNILMWGLVIAAAGLFWIGYQNRDSLLGRPEPLNPEFQAIVDQCSLVRTHCNGNIIRRTNGTQWLIGSLTPQNETREWEAMISSRFEGVEDVVFFGDTDYLDALADNIGRTEPEVPAAEEVVVPLETRVPATDAEPPL